MKTKIAFISDHASPLAQPGSIDCGGQNVYVAELAKKLAEEGYEVDIFTRQDHAGDEIIHWMPGIRVIHVPAGPPAFIAKEDLLPYMEDFAAWMISFISNHNLSYDLVHAHFFMSALVASKLKAVYRIPYVVTFHALGKVRKIHQKGSDSFPAERIHIENFVMHDADGIIAECTEDWYDMQKLYGADPARLSVIPCGYNPAEFFPVAQQRCRQLLYLPGKARILTHIGRMVPRKGIDNIIRALQILEPQGSGIFLVVVGGTENDFLRGEVARLKAIAAESQVCDNVIFTGNKPRHLLKYYYGASDIFITTPWYEPFGITPLEAMACGIPVIGSSVGGIKFSVKHGETGLLVPPKSPAALAIAVDRLLNDAPLLNSMKENAVERTKRLFRWEEIARQVSELYHHTIWMAKPVGAFSKSA